MKISDTDYISVKIKISSNYYKIVLSDKKKLDFNLVGKENEIYDLLQELINKVNLQAAEILHESTDSKCKLKKNKISEKEISVEEPSVIKTEFPKSNPTSAYQPLHIPPNPNLKSWASLSEQDQNNLQNIANNFSKVCDFQKKENFEQEDIVKEDQQITLPSTETKSILNLGVLKMDLSEI